MYEILLQQCPGYLLGFAAVNSQDTPTIHLDQTALFEKFGYSIGSFLKRRISLGMGNDRAEIGREDLVHCVSHLNDRKVRWSLYQDVAAVIQRQNSPSFESIQELTTDEILGSGVESHVVQKTRLGKSAPVLQFIHCLTKALLDGLRIEVVEQVEEHMWSRYHFSRSPRVSFTEHLDHSVDGGRPIIYPRDNMGMNINEERELTLACITRISRAEEIAKRRDKLVHS